MTEPRSTTERTVSENGARRTGVAVGASALLLVLLCVLAIGLGSVRLAPSEVVAAIARRSGGDEVARTIVWSVRLPRTVTATTVGAALAVAGLLMQTLFRNPLADASVLGVSAGASLGVALAMLSSTSSLAVVGRFAGVTALGVTVAAIIGAASVLVVVLLIAQRVRSQVTVLVAGLMVATFVGSIVSLLVYFASLDAGRAYGAWALGSFRGTTWHELGFLVPSCLLGIAIACALSKPLDALLLGDQAAASLGVSLLRVRLGTITAAALCAGATAAFCGPIAFIGLATPQLSRALLRSSRHRPLVPVTALCGAALALACEVVAQWPGDDRVLPLNAITALFGAPVVLWVLLRRDGVRS